ncbi:hypothetical protein PUN28_002426 [Cardiocondyla obscurior]|uniref:Mos1 transposase HTH domain-containing protein n=1 Tax=Cardiocondyla obscurior TaxID=286306 RepID=A0AAW2GU35_9HYME
MSNFVPKKEYLRTILLHYFIQKMTAVEAHRILVETYGDYALSETTCRDWFRRFKNDDFDVEDKARSGAPKKFEDEELQALLQQDSGQTLTELGESLGVDHSTIWKRLKALEMIQKQGHWLPHQLKQRDIEKRFFTCEQLLQRHRKKGFLYSIVTGGQKWVHYDNPKKRKGTNRPTQPSTSSTNPNSHGSKILFCIWWDHLGVIYYELLKPNEIITADRYKQQLMQLNEVLKEKRPQYQQRHNKVIFQHGNVRPHIVKSAKIYLESLKWEVLPHVPYSPDITPSDFHLFRSMAHGLAEQDFQSCEEVKTWINAWIESKDESFFQRGIEMLPERWEKVVASDGQYFQ